MRHEARNAAICDDYRNGILIASICVVYNLKRQRVQQILKAASLWSPHAKSGRTKFLGVTISEETKNGLKQKAEAADVSVSQLASDALDALVKK